jgi:Ca2+-binding EF-hand superfamily protein
MSTFARVLRYYRHYSSEVHMKKSALLIVCSFMASACLAQGAAGRADRFAQMDSDADGSVTREDEEFIAARGVMFEKRDRNSDGYIDSTDIGKRAARRGGERIDRMLEHLDADKDGKVSRDEFVSAEAPIFTRADQDSNGTLDATEIEHAKAAMQSQMRRHRAQ